MAANIITCLRILLSAVLLFCQTYSVPFCILYLIAGLSDMLDGTIARRTGTAGESGAKLDTAADCVFAAVCLIKWLPAMGIPGWLYVWIGMITVIKGINHVSGYVILRRFVTVHTAANKAVGALLFIFPLTRAFIDLRLSAIVVCMAATAAAIQEGHYIHVNERKREAKPDERYL